LQLNRDDARLIVFYRGVWGAPVLFKYACTVTRKLEHPLQKNPAGAPASETGNSCFSYRIYRPYYISIVAPTIRFFLTTYEASPNTYNNNNNIVLWQWRMVK